MEKYQRERPEDVWDLVGVGFVKCLSALNWIQGGIVNNGQQFERRI
jgi:hypothetical protein